MSRQVAIRVANLGERRATYAVISSMVRTSWLRSFLQEQPSLRLAFSPERPSSSWSSSQRSFSQPSFSLETLFLLRSSSLQRLSVWGLTLWSLLAHWLKMGCQTFQPHPVRASVVGQVLQEGNSPRSMCSLTVHRGRLAPRQEVDQASEPPSTTVALPHEAAVQSRRGVRPFCERRLPLSSHHRLTARHALASAFGADWLRQPSSFPLRLDRRGG